MNILDNRKSRLQKTLCRSVTYEGVGIHSGKSVLMTLSPGEVNSGVVFFREDLPGQPFFKASVSTILNASRSTTLGNHAFSVRTVEHLLAALYACEIDNVRISLNAQEVPIGDGSAQPFIDLILKAGYQEQSSPVNEIYLEGPIYWSHEEAHIVALPSHNFKISYTLDYPNKGKYSTQYQSFNVDQQTFINELAPCRTFCQFEELQYLLDNGYIKGGSLDNAVVLKGDEVMNSDGLRFSDEMVRHKMLDIVGDLSLLGVLHVHIIAIRTGHLANTELAKKIYKNCISRECRHVV